MNTPTGPTIDLPPTRTLAKLYEKQGLLKEAADMYRRLLRRDPEDETLRADLERIEGESGAGDEDGSADMSRAKAVLSRLEMWRRAISTRKEGLQSPEKRRMAVLIRIVARPGEDGAGTVWTEEDGPADTWSGLEDVATAAGLVLDQRFCNSEEAVVENVSELPEACGALILDCLNVAVCGEAVKEVLSSLRIPVIEVYPANIYKKDLCLKPVISPAVTGQLVGFGDQGCAMAVRAAADMMGEGRTTGRDAQGVSGPEERSQEVNSSVAKVEDAADARREG